MPESRIQTTSRTTLQTTTRSRGVRETSSRPSEVLDGHDMVVTTFHLLSDGLVGARPTQIMIVIISLSSADWPTSAMCVGVLRR